MPVYFFTFHAFRSWRLDDPRGYIQRDQPGVQRPNARLDKHREQSAKEPAVRFSRSQQKVLIASARDITSRRGWILYAMSATPTHTHLLIGFLEQVEVETCRNRLKSLLGKSLSDDLGRTGKRWFSRGHHTEQVVDERHMQHLIEQYIPKHTSENGVVYRKTWGNDSE